MNDRARDAPPPRPRYGTGAEDAGREHGHWEAPVADRPPSTSLAETLEPGPLRDELRRGAGSPAAVARALPAHLARLQFTGEGAEYFRIWIVNLLLTVATLGVYSAWAKVRKTRYFWQNTRLEGHAFDFHGSPRAILLGRVLALVLLAGYTFAFDFSRTAGLAMIVVLCVAGPWLFMRAQRFKLGNTSWRGLRFGFDGDAADAYRIVLPPILIWFSGAIIAMLASERGILAAFAGLVTSMLVPWMHHRLKAWQHDRARYGDRTFSFLPATGRFYGVYFVAGLIGAGVALGAVTVAGIAMSLTLGAGDRADAQAAGVFAFVFAVVLGLAAFLLSWPYFAARLQAIVWSSTRIGDVRFATAIAPGPLMRIIAKNTLLTLATLGLYWPYAAVALARYRVECMRAESATPLVALATAATGTSGAAGDASVEAFGLDIGL